jgi:tetratricopeptide (TPR) repeat protein
MFELDEDRLINPELEAEYTQMSLEDAIYVAKDSSSAESLETQADSEPEALGQEAAIEGDEASETASEMHILEEIQSDLEAIELNIESCEGELPIVGSDEIEIEAESPYDQGESAEIEPETDDAGPEPTLYSFKPDWGDESESLPDTELSGPDSIAGQSIFEADEALSDFDGKSSEQAEAEEVQEAESLSGIYYSLDGEAGLGEAEETDFGISGFELSGLAGDGPDDGIQEAEAVEFVPIAEEAMLESLLPEAADEFLGLDELLPEAENPIFIQDDASEPSLIIKHDLSDSEAADTGELPGMPVLSEEFLEIELAEGIGSDQDEPGQAALLASDEFTPSLDDELEGLVGELVDEAAESLLGSFEAVDIPMSLEEAVAEVKDVLDAITAQSESDWQADSVISSDGIDSTGSIDRFIAPTLEEASNETLQTEDSFSEPEGIISPAGGTGMQPEEIELEIEPLEAIESIETEAFEILAEDSSDVPAENEIGESEDEPVKASPFELGSLADLIPEEPEAQAPAPAQTAEEILLGLLNQDTELPASIIEKIRSGERIASESPAKNGSEVIFESSDFTITRIGKAAKEGIEGESPPDTLTGQFKPLAENPSEDAASENESSESPYKDHSIPLTSVGESTQAAQPEELEPMPERRIPRNFQESVNENSAIVSLTQNENAAAIASNGEEAPREAESIYAADISDLKQQTTSPFLLGSTRQAQLSEDYDSSCDTIFYAKQEAPAISRIKTELPINDFAQTGSIYLYPNKAKEERALNAQPLVHGLSDGTEDEAIDASMPIVQLDEQAGKADWTSDEDGFKTMNLFSDIVRATDSSLPEADPITMIQASIDGADMELGLYSDSAYVTQDRQPELKKKPRMYKVASYKPMAASAETIASAAIPSSIRALRPIQTQRRPYEMLQRDTEPGLGGATAAAATMFDEDIINPTPKARNRLMEESILRRGWVKILVFVLAAALAASGFYIYRQNAKYGEALRKMNAGSYFEAKAAFEAIRNYKDSEAKAAECNTQLQSQYNNALSLYNDEQYQGAMEVFMHLGSFKDSRIYLKECQSEIKYKEAVTKLERNEFYEAYRIFTQLGEYKTSATDAQNCIQPEPETAYRIEDEAFSKGTAEEKTIVELRNPAGASNSVFIKIYDKQGKLAVTAYLQANTAVSATFLGGEYKIHAAFGTNWFGAEDVFGDEGEYSLRYIDEESDYIEMLGNYRSTQTFLSRSDSGESLKRIDRSEF